MDFDSILLSAIFLLILFQTIALFAFIYIYQNERNRRNRLVQDISLIFSDKLFLFINERFDKEFTEVINKMIVKFSER